MIRVILIDQYVKRRIGGILFFEMVVDISIIVGVLVVFSTVLISMTLHEAMHAYVSHWLGDDTAAMLGRLTLNPIKHIDPIMTVVMPIALFMAGLTPFGAAKPVPFNPSRLRYGEYGSALVGLAGPLTNLFLAIVSGLWLRFVIGLGSGAVSEVLLLFMIVNLSFFTFNMLPIPPLDGSRALYAIAPDGLREVMRQIEAQGILLVGLIVVFAFPVIQPILTGVIRFLTTMILGTSVF